MAARHLFLMLAITAGAVGCGSEAATEADSFDVTSGARANWVRGEISSHNAWLSEGLRSEKYAAMAGSPVDFFRGTNHLYWADFADDPSLEDFGRESTRTFLQGDLHVGNFGSFGDDEGRVVYDVNDYDEAIVADYQLDLWRGAVSIALVSYELGLDSSDRKAAVTAFAKAYLHACEDFVGNDDEEARTVTADSAEGPLAEFLADVAGNKTRAKMLSKWTTVAHGERRLASGDNEDLAPLDGLERDALLSAFEGYGATLSGGLSWDESYFSVKDAALRLHAGVASLGVPRYYLLIEGPTSSLDDDVILDVKLVPGATGLDYLSVDDGFATAAERAVAGQKALLTDTDDHLGWFDLDGGSYVVRERSPYKDDLALDDIEGAAALQSLATQWGAILAADHARADRDFDDQLVTSSLEEGVIDATDGQRTKFYGRVWKVAWEYASQVRRDWKSFLAMVD